MANYRKVYKSDHLGVVDLEEMIEQGKPLIFTIKEVKQEINTNVGGNKGNFNIAYFVENIKPWVLNAGNAAIVRSFSDKKSIDTDFWKNIPVELYIDATVKMLGQVVGGIRIKPLQPKSKVKPLFTEANFEKAKNANATMEAIEKAYQLTEEVKTKYLEYVGATTN